VSGERGWLEHQHVRNPEYNRVVLDVCLWEIEHHSLPRSEADQPIPQLVLQPYLLASLDELVESIDPDRYPFSPRRHTIRSHPLDEVSSESLPELIQSAALYRLEQKASRFDHWISQFGDEQTAYMGVAETLGYKHNKISFRNIALELPLVQLQSISEVDQKIEALFSVKANHPLRIHQVRPANHPERRLATLALIVHRFPSFVKWFTDLVESQNQMVSPPSLQHLFWSTHYHLKGKLLPKPISLLGEQRWRDLLMNAIIPFSWARNRLHGDEEKAQQILDLYQSLPASENNLPLRQTLFNLRMKRPRSAFEQQGILQIVQDFEFLAPSTLHALHDPATA
jgi:hypothetical protein